jgi:general stress protein YciG
MAEKNKAAQELGRLGGAKGGRARAKNMTKKELSEAGRKAANARWEKWRRERQQEGSS